MSNEIERDDEEFMRLKEEALKQITYENANSMFEEGRDDVMTRLEKLNPKNITEVEDLYVAFAVVWASAIYVCAIDKAYEKGTLPADEIEGVSVNSDLIHSKLYDMFASSPKSEYLYKVIEIDNDYKPGKEFWALEHSRLFQIEIDRNNFYIRQLLDSIILPYKNNLEKDLLENKVDLMSLNNMPQETSPIIKQLTSIYRIICELEDTLKTNKMGRLKQAQRQIERCIQSSSVSAELPFLTTLQSVLFLGQKKYSSLRREFYDSELQRHSQQEETSRWDSRIQLSILSAMDSAIYKYKDLAIRQLLSEIKTDFMRVNNQSFALDKFLLVIATADPEFQVIHLNIQEDAALRFKENATAYAGEDKVLSASIESIIENRRKNVTDTIFNDMHARLISERSIIKQPIEHKLPCEQSAAVKTLFKLEKLLLDYHLHLEEKYINGVTYNFIGVKKYQVLSSMLEEVDYLHPVKSMSDIGSLFNEHRSLLSQHATKIDEDNRVDIGFFQQLKYWFMKFGFFNKGVKLSQDIEATIDNVYRKASP